MINSMMWIVYGCGFAMMADIPNTIIMIAPNVVTVICCLAEIVAFCIFKNKNEPLLNSE